MPCQPPKTNTDKTYSVYYSEYYRGTRDKHNRKDGQGEYHWTGARSMEWYEGQMLRDTMHGTGQYSIRYESGNHSAMTYEGWFYNNNMYGYGVMSYADGQTFTGLFYNNVRWGPGILSHACVREDVGLWSGTQLVRLAWRPPVPSVAIDLASTAIGQEIIKPHRIQLNSNIKIIGEINPAIELLKKHGANPKAAAENWTKLYPKNCTDTSSQLCNIQAFDKAYYDKEINTLTEISDDDKTDENVTRYYVWNNNETMIHMMRHCYKHDHQTKNANDYLEDILCDNRSTFKPPNKHEFDCRSLLMVSYLGNIANVAQLVNECDVNPNVTDSQGNSAIMYAACGDQPVVIHFLREAGGSVDCYNDACCTPLGVTLLRYALARWEIAPKDALQAVVPSTLDTSPEAQAEASALEWKIKRFIPQTPMSVIQTGAAIQGSLASKSSKIFKSTSQQSEKKLASNIAITQNEADDKLNENKQVYQNISDEYTTEVNEIFSTVNAKTNVPYLFEVVDMAKEVIFHDEDKKPADPSKATSKVLKDTVRPSREIDPQGIKSENGFGDKDKTVQDTLDRIMSTIVQLVSDGADPRKVFCPQPALFVATVARSPELVDLLVKHGTNVNELYPRALGYLPIDIAVNGPLSYDNLDVVRALLKNGAKTDHRLISPSYLSDTQLDDGPTLLHLVLMKKVDTEAEVDVRQQLIELLLEYGCDPTIQCRGRSAVDVAMSKSFALLDVFIKSPATDLNAVINAENQNVLMKMFHPVFCKKQTLSDKLQTVTNLLLFGADPLLKCQFGNECYDNLFVYANKNLSEMTRHKASGSATAIKSVKNLKKNVDKKTLEAPSKKNLVGGGESADYKQALDLVVECARMLYIRWLQAKLLKELTEVVNKYVHRHWNLIMKEYKNLKCIGLWVNTARAFEIFDILKTSKKKLYKDHRVMKSALCIVHYCFKNTRNELKGNIVTSAQKAQIEREVSTLIREHKLASMSTQDMGPNLRPYVAPEFTTKGLEKFNICFECAMPLTGEAIQCELCNLISFCSLACINQNVERQNCHPCSSFLKELYFLNIDEENSIII